MDGTASKRVWSVQCFRIFRSSDTLDDVCSEENPIFRSSFVSSCSVVYMTMRRVPAIPVMYYTFFWHLCRFASINCLYLTFDVTLFSRNLVDSWLSFDSLAVCDFRLPPPRDWGLRSSAQLQSVDWKVKIKGKAVPLQTWTGPEGSRKLRFPDFMTTAQDGGEVVSLTHLPPLPPGNIPGTHFC